MREFRVLAAAAIGGAIGQALFFWLAAHGYYGLAIPGALAGVGGAILRTRSMITPLMTAAIALAAGVITAWRFAPLADPTLGAFVRHVPQLGFAPLAMLIIGTFAGFWFPFRRRDRSSR